MSVNTGGVAGLSFPNDTFARLTPVPYLTAHLKQPQGTRANGRRPQEARDPKINTGSLSHTHGSAVVRLGDTAVVCGIRGEILLASDVPNYPHDALKNHDLVDRLGLVVPNVELSTGCSSAHLPGNPPGTLAQALSYRVSSLFYDVDLISAEDLKIEHSQPADEDDADSERVPVMVTKAFWTLYIDILCLALDGNAFDAAWLATMAALKNVRLPKAAWDQDREVVICSPVLEHSKPLHLPESLPISATFAMFTTRSPVKQKDEAESWLLADPDATEEDACSEILSIVSWLGGIKIEKAGGSNVGPTLLARCITGAIRRNAAIQSLL